MNIRIDPFGSKLDGVNSYMWTAMYDLSHQKKRQSWKLPTKWYRSSFSRTAEER